MAIELFPKNQLGSDADMLSQLRSGALELFAQTGVLMSTLVPVASISGVGFAFPSYDKVWEALDGPLGRHIRGAFEKANLVCMEKSYNHGYRQTTSSTRPIRTPDDFNGFKIRVPPSPLWTSMFKAFGAAPVSIPWGETYSAMQTRIADGLEQPLIGLLVDKMYEVQKSCSLTNHMWDGFWVLANRRAWERIPPALREIVERNINQEALVQRREVEHLNATLQGELQSRGLEFFKVNNADFRSGWSARLLPGMAEALRRRGVVAARSHHRQARLREAPMSFGTSRFADLDGVTLHYREAGAGEDVVVLVHGIPQTSHEWRHVVPRLAERYRVIAPDLRGLGDSSRPATGYDKKTLAEDVWRLVRDHLGVERFFLVGHDWGGPVAFSSRRTIRGGAPAGDPRRGDPGRRRRLSQGGRRWHHAFFRTLDLPEALCHGREDLVVGWLFDHYGHRPNAISPRTSASTSAPTPPSGRSGRCSASTGRCRSTPRTTGRSWPATASSGCRSWRSAATRASGAGWSASSPCAGSPRTCAAAWCRSAATGSRRSSRTGCATRCWGSSARRGRDPRRIESESRDRARLCAGPRQRQIRSQDHIRGPAVGRRSRNRIQT